jgi:hypothetical protein
VEAEDGSLVRRVTAVYTFGDGHWYSKNLVFDPVTYKWLGSVPARGPMTWFVEVLDGAGNVRTLNNKGLYYRLDLRVYPVYLPTILR